MGADMCVSEREPSKHGRAAKEHRQASKDAFIAAARTQLGSPERSRGGGRKTLGAGGAAAAAAGSAAAAAAAAGAGGGGGASGGRGVPILGARRADEPAWVGAARAELTAACEQADAVAAAEDAAGGGGGLPSRCAMPTPSGRRK